MDVAQLGEGFADLRRLARRQGAAAFLRGLRHGRVPGLQGGVLARQELGGGLSDLANAEGVDEPVEADVAARLDGAHQVARR